MRLTSLVAWLVLFLALGCAPTRTAVELESTSLRGYDIGEPLQTTIGDPLWRVSVGKGVPTFLPLREFDAAVLYGQGTELTVTQEQKWVAARQLGDGYIILPPEDVDGNLGVHITSDGSIGKGWVRVNQRDYIKQGKWPEGKLFRRTAPITIEDDVFQAEFVYSGRTGDNLRFLYREYSESLARPAFSQEVQYDLSQSDTIRFKSVTMEVLEASNQEVTARIIDDGGLPWLPAQ